MKKILYTAICACSILCGAQAQTPGSEVPNLKKLYELTAVSYTHLDVYKRQSSIKRIRQTNARRLRNRYYAKTARNAMKVLRATEDKNEAQALFPKVRCV